MHAACVKHLYKGHVSQESGSKPHGGGVGRGTLPRLCSNIFFGAANNFCVNGDNDNAVLFVSQLDSLDHSAALVRQRKIFRILAYIYPRATFFLPSHSLCILTRLMLHYYIPPLYYPKLLDK